MRTAAPTGLFLAFAFGVSWAVWLPLVMGFSLPVGYYYLAALGPALGALVAQATQGRTAMVDWVRRRLGSLGPGDLWALVFGGLTATVALAAMVEALATGQVAWSTLGTTAELPGWSPAAVVALVTVSYGLCEEIGWRGWLFPTWSLRWGPRKASLAVGGVWCLWHLPAFFCNPTYQAMGWASLGWAFSLVAGSVLLGWMVDEARGSLWPVVVWHSTFDALTISDAAAPFLAPLLSMVVLLVVPLVWFRSKRGVRLSKTEPQPRHGSKESL